ncbi:hypothetical protein [Novacetimonas pomaceti]|uniref:hypothetical protein n=1 Tax=Novacetimonas pomaceti TaxID=2021998 RepID=UPI001C2D302F|nr:hypothetical protein [Novacetimonas pomaceti]MBV1834113.1 hypothetical protein [Novacetimonas pomaceti]
MWKKIAFLILGTTLAAIICWIIYILSKGTIEFFYHAMPMLTFSVLFFGVLAILYIISRLIPFKMSAIAMIAEQFNKNKDDPNDVRYHIHTFGGVTSVKEVQGGGAVFAVLGGIFLFIIVPSGVVADLPLELYKGIYLSGTHLDDSGPSIYPLYVKLESVVSFVLAALISNKMSLPILAFCIIIGLFLLVLLLPCGAIYYLISS